MSLDQQVKALERKLNKISTVETTRAYASAVNKTATIIRRDIAKKVAQSKRIRQRDVIKRIFYRRANAKKPFGDLVFYANPLSGINVPFSANKKGFKVAGEQRARSFFAKMPNQKRHHIYQRKGKARTPIRIVSVHINDVVKEHALRSAKDIMKSRFTPLFKHELNARLKGYVTRRN